MKTLWVKALILTGALTLPSHAILGFGVHLAPAFGPEMKNSSGSIMPTGQDPNYARILTGSSSGLQGLGFKFWFDALPVIDLEATGNVQFGYYDLSTIVNGDTTKVDADLGLPMADAKPLYGRMTGDVAVLYPFFSIPLVKFSAGGGLSYGVGTPVLNAKFAKKALTEANITTSSTEDEIVEALKDAVSDKDNFKSGMGFFVQAGAKVKPPIIPLAAYANLKYGFGGPSVSGVDNLGGGLTVELGGAIAF